MYDISYKECKKWISNNLPDVDTLEKWKNSKKPKFIPRYPQRVFPEFKTWGDFLGTGRKHNIEQTKNYLTYNQAKSIIKNLNIQSISEWRRPETLSRRRLLCSTPAR